MSCLKSRHPTFPSISTSFIEQFCYAIRPPGQFAVLNQSLVKSVFLVQPADLNQPSLVNSLSLLKRSFLVNPLLNCSFLVNSPLNQSLVNPPPCVESIGRENFAHTTSYSNLPTPARRGAAHSRQPARPFPHMMLQIWI